MSNNELVLSTYINTNESLNNYGEKKKIVRKRKNNKNNTASEYAKQQGLLSAMIARGISK